MSIRHLCTTKTKLRKVLEFCDTDITARTLGETHVSTDDLTQLVSVLSANSRHRGIFDAEITHENNLLRREEPCHVKDIFRKEMY